MEQKFISKDPECLVLLTWMSPCILVKALFCVVDPPESHCVIEKHVGLNCV